MRVIKLKQIVRVFSILLFCNSITSIASANPLIPNNAETKSIFLDEAFLSPSLELKRLASYYSQLRFYTNRSGKIANANSDIETFNIDDQLLISGRYKSLLVTNFEGNIDLKNFKLLQDITPKSQYRFDYKIVENSELQELGFSQYGHLIFPINILSEILDLLFRFIANFFAPSFGIAIIILALTVKCFLMPIEMKSVKSNQKVTEISHKITADINTIKLEYKGEQAHIKTLQVYKKYSVSPFYQLKPLLYLFIQIPILISIFNILGVYAAFQNSTFLGINDLSVPDGAISIYGLYGKINLLPIILLLFHLITTVIDRQKRFAPKYYFIALGSFILVYDFPSALVLYWLTANTLEDALGRGVKRYGVRLNT